MDYAALKDWTFPQIVRTYGQKDTILYALGVGCATEEEDLRFVFEGALEALPTMATALAEPGFWLADPRLAADIHKIVHGSQSITLHAPLPAEATVTGQTTIDRVIDKGKERGAYVHLTNEIREQASGQLLATLKSVIVMRGDGGFGGPTEASEPRTGLPDRPCDLTFVNPILPQAALLYRLSGDLTPLHADPEFARKAGFPGPILHGLCTMGVATRAILKTCCDNDPTRLREMGVRFKAVVFPGETLRTEIWRDGDDIAFHTSVEERGVAVLEGEATLAGKKA